MNDADARPDGEVYRVRAAGVTWRQTDAEAVVLDLEESVYYGLNHLGTLLWKRLADGATREDLIDLLVAGGAPAAAASEDVDAFLSELVSFGLLLR